MTRRKKLMFWVGTIAAVLVVAAAGVWILGRNIDREHEANVTRDLAAPPERVWKLITDVERFPSWRSGLAKVEVTERGPDHVVAWVEHSSFGPMPLRVVEWNPPQRLVTRIDSDELGFGGTWTWEIRPQGEGSTLSITERGTIDNALFRVLSKYVFGYSATLTRVQDALAAKLRER